MIRSTMPEYTDQAEILQTIFFLVCGGCSGLFATRILVYFVKPDCYTMLIRSILNHPEPVHLAYILKLCRGQ